jgi:hypothetical protein
MRSQIFSYTTFDSISDARFRDTSRKTVEFLLSIQRKEGYMVSPPYTSIEDQPMRTTVDNTAEFCSWLAEAAMELA